MTGDYGLLPENADILRSIAYYILQDTPWLFVLIIFLVALNFILISHSFPTSRLNKFVDNIYKKLFKRNTILLIGVLTLSFANLLFLSSNYLEKIIHVPDEYGYLFTAKTFAQNRLYLSPPRYPEHYEQLITIDDKWVSQYTPGHPFLLLFGVLVNQAWLVPPILATISAFYIFKTAKLLFGKKVAWISLLFLISSPFYQMNSINFMSHNSAFFAGSCVLYYSALFIKTGNKKKLILVGLYSVLMIMVRLYTGLLFLLPIYPFIIKGFLFNGWKYFFKCCGYLILGSIPFCAFFLLFNFYTTSNPFVMTTNYGDYSTLGFPEYRLLGEGFSDLLISIFTLRECLFAIPFSLIFIIAFIASFKNKSNCWFIILPVLSIIIGYFFYKGVWMMYGPRFWYEAIGLLAIIAAVGFSQIPHIVDVFLRVKKLYKVYLDIILLVILGILLTISLSRWYKTDLVPRWHEDFTPINVGELKNFNWAKPDLLNSIKSQKISNAVIFIDPGGQWWNYLVEGIEMDFTFRDNIIYVKDLGDENNQRIKDQYPDRAYYKGNYDTGIIEPY